MYVQQSSMHTMHKKAGEVGRKCMGAMLNHYLLSQSHHSSLTFLTATSITVTHGENGSPNEEKNNIANLEV